MNDIFFLVNTTLKTHHFHLYHHNSCMTHRKEKKKKKIKIKQKGKRWQEAGWGTTNEFPESSWAFLFWNPDRLLLLTGKCHILNWFEGVKTSDGNVVVCDFLFTALNCSLNFITREAMMEDTSSRFMGLSALKIVSLWTDSHLICVR